MRKLLFISLLFCGCASLPVAKPAITAPETDSLVLYCNGMHFFSQPLSQSMRMLCVEDSAGTKVQASVPYVKGSLKLKYAACGWVVFTMSAADKLPYEVYASKYDSAADFQIFKLQ